MVLVRKRGLARARVFWLLCLAVCQFAIKIELAHRHSIFTKPSDPLCMAVCQFELAACTPGSPRNIDQVPFCTPAWECWRCGNSNRSLAPQDRCEIRPHMFRSAPQHSMALLAVWQSCSPASDCQGWQGGAICDCHLAHVRLYASSGYAEGSPPSKLLSICTT